MSFREIQTATDVINYQNRLTSNYPDRPEIIKWIIREIQRIEAENPTVAELCIGSGQLARAMCEAVPKIQYVGLDFMQPFIDFTAGNHVIQGVNAAFVCADLTADEWPSLLSNAASSAPFNAIVSMQSLHDVGGSESTSHIYQQCQRLLSPKGFLINADLITQVGDEENARPGRLTVPHHLELLSKAGFTTSSCLFQNDLFGICIGENG